MTVINGSVLDPQELGKQLNACYERIAELTINPTDDTAEELLRTVQEGSQLMAQLTEAMQAGQPNPLSRDELLKLQQRITALSQSVRQQMSNKKSQIVKIKKGQTAIKGYRPIQMGMGFNEGKFIDSKK